ncbi:MAG: CehA/McbA family metallohydrolase [Acidobacteria bacterium]|nr:CehA/McbA family metallohydrolase [Acidobacteriota bacterium]
MKLTRRQFHQRALAASVGCFLPAVRSLHAEQSVETQPLYAQVERVLQALAMIGEPLPAADVSSIHQQMKRAGDASRDVMAILDRYVLMNVTVNPENRVSVSRGAAPAVLYEAGWKSFLVKIDNQSMTTAPFKVKSPQGGAMGRKSSLAIEGVHDFTNGAVDSVEARARWIAVATFDAPPMAATLSGLPVEYRILQLYSRDHGKREASLTADLGFGEQDLGFRSTLPVLFECIPAHRVNLDVRDEKGRPTTASFLVMDALGRIYPTQTKRDLPDLAFEPQVYRRNGETLLLPTGEYTVEMGRGPEYLRVRKQLTVNAQPATLHVSLFRWIDPSTQGYYSGDTHIHAAGCSHYESPTEGVPPEVMDRQVEGEALDVGSVLNWGPGFEYQKQFFSGHVQHPQTGIAAEPTIRYDIEVSGFPSSHCGHLVLLQLKDQHYPGTHTINDWPSWNIPILKWAKAQGAVVGYAHSGHGLVVDSTQLPNLLMPPFNSSGANEYIVDVTQEGIIDFISGCDLWPFAEMNIWYHTLNCGFRTAFAGETDFPCLTDECVGGGRSYVHMQGTPAGDTGYGEWLQNLLHGDAYFGDGRSHIFNFKVEGQGRSKEDVKLSAAKTVEVTADICALLAEHPNDKLRAIQHASPYDKPYWHLERARMGNTRTVMVELVVNGLPVASTPITADGTVQPVRFTHSIAKSSWVALRIYPSAHTNPIMVEVGGKPVRASLASAQWCRKAVDVCWGQKSLRIRKEELPDAAHAYAHARTTYDRLIEECRQAERS